MAEDLVQIQQEFADQGVRFIGLTADDGATAARFVKHYGITWPNGYEAHEAIAALRAFGPSVFIVGACGQILWHDAQMRFHHGEAALPKYLRQALEGAL